MKNLSIFCIIFCAFCLLYVGCIGTDTLPVPPQDGFPKLSIAEESPTAFKIGESHTYRVKYNNIQSTEQSVDVTWTSTDVGVVSIDATGKAIAQASGLAFIIASYENLRDSLQINVVENDTSVASIRLSSSKTLLGVGEVLSINAHALNIEGDTIKDVSFEWESNSEHITIDQEGMATGQSLGAAIITASLEGVMSNSLELEVVGIRTGTFVGFAGYNPTGSVSMLIDDGKIFLEFSADFSGGGPSPLAYLSNENTSGRAQIDGGAVEIVSTRDKLPKWANKFGSPMRFEVPSSVGFNQYKYVYIHCTLGPGLGIAELN